MNTVKTQTIAALSLGKTGWIARLKLALTLRRERRNLQRLSDVHLRDIGVTRAEADAESARAGWDAPSHWKR